MRDMDYVDVETAIISNGIELNFGVCVSVCDRS